jgi:hypothetical protein
MLSKLSNYEGLSPMALHVRIVYLFVISFVFMYNLFDSLLSKLFFRKAGAYSLTFHHGGVGSVPSQVSWDVWWTK